MDDTKKYIKMSEKAEEIQEERPSYWKLGDWFWDEAEGRVAVSSAVGETDRLRFDGEFWLPTQADLQEMLNEFWVGHWTQLVLLWECIANDDGYYGRQFDTWEQLWLGLVMKEKYHKIWNGEDWVKEVKE